MESYEIFKQQMTANLKQVEAIIAQYGTKVEKASADAKEKLQSHYSDLEQKKYDFKRKLRELEQASSSAFGKVQKKVENAWDELSDSLTQSSKAIREHLH